MAGIPVDRPQGERLYEILNIINIIFTDFNYKKYIVRLDFYLYLRYVFLLLLFKPNPYQRSKKKRNTDFQIFNIHCFKNSNIDCFQSHNFSSSSIFM